MKEIELRVTAMAGLYAVCRLERDAAAPMWAWEGEGFVSVTQTKDEVSVLCAEERIPEGGGGVMKPERGFRGLKVTGPLDFGMVGVLSRLTTALAEAGVPVFSVSTYDTDYLFVPDGKLREAVEALRSAGIKVDG